MVSTQKWLTFQVELTENQNPACRFFELKLAGQSLLKVRNPQKLQGDGGSGGGVLEVEVPTDPTNPIPPSGGQAGSAFGVMPSSGVMTHALPVVQVVKNETSGTKVVLVIPINQK